MWLHIAGVFYSGCGYILRVCIIVGVAGPLRVLYVLVERASGEGVELVLTASDGASAWAGSLSRGRMQELAR